MDGYDVEITEELTDAQQLERLYFVNLGGYDSKQFTELHQNILVVAENDREAKAKALKKMSGWKHAQRLFV